MFNRARMNRIKLNGPWRITPAAPVLSGPDPARGTMARLGPDPILSTMTRA